MARRSAIRDDQWQQSESVLPGRAESVGVTAKDHRVFVDAVLSRYRAGIPWRELPERCGDWQNVQQRWSRWAARGVWERGCTSLAAEADNAYAMSDATMVRAPQHSAGATGGTGRRQRSDAPQAG
jgi:transposase